MTTDLLCLSSGLTIRYRQDILRALALPFQAHVQFRYSKDIVDPSLMSGLQNDQLAGSIALLAHVDCAKGAKRADETCFITPCRRAVLISSRKVGDYFVLVFQLWGYATTADLEVFQTKVSTARPHWNGDSLEGMWCIPTTHGSEWRQTFGLEGFQHVARKLHTRGDFAQQPFFFAVEALSERGGPDALKPTATGEFVLSAGKHFDLNVFHFAPADDHNIALELTAATASITVSLTSSVLEPVTAPSLAIDSPYDLKTFAFRATDKIGSTQSAAIVIRALKPGATESDPLHPELHLPVRVEMSIAKTAMQIGALTILLFVQQYIAASARGAVAPSIGVTLFFLALLTAGFAVLALKRPF